MPLKDEAIALLNVRIDDALVRSDGVAESLAEHVRDCAAIQRRVLIVACFILGWIIAHSSEAAKLMVLIFG